PYSVEGSTLHVAVREDTGHVLYRWQPGTGPVKVLALENTGALIGSFSDVTDLVVQGHVAVYRVEDSTVGTARVYRLDLDKGISKVISGSYQVKSILHVDASGIALEPEEAIGSTGGSSPPSAIVLYWDASTETVRDIASEIRNNAYRLSPSFSTAHYY